MKEKKLHLGKVDVVLHSTSPLLKTLLIVLIVFSIAAMGALAWVQHGLRAKTEVMRQEALELQRENEIYQERIDNPDDFNILREMAEDELKMVLPDFVLFGLH